MSYSKIKFSVMFLIIFFLGNSSLFAQYKIERGCFSGGCISVSGDDYNIENTIAQTAIGRITNSTFLIQSGFQEVVLYATPIEYSLMNLPFKFDVFQNYPNPFNPATTIRYALPRPAFVKIDIYNILGQHMISLVNEYKPAGFHITRFNANNFASSLYFYTITADDFFAVKKMLLTK